MNMSGCRGRPGLRTGAFFVIPCSGSIFRRAVGRRFPNLGAADRCSEGALCGGECVCGPSQAVGAAAVTSLHRPVARGCFRSRMPLPKCGAQECAAGSDGARVRASAGGIRSVPLLVSITTRRQAEGTARLSGTTQPFTKICSLSSSGQPGYPYTASAGEPCRELAVIPMRPCPPHI